MQLQTELTDALAKQIEQGEYCDIQLGEYCSGPDAEADSAG